MFLLPCFIYSALVVHTFTLVTDSEYVALGSLLDFPFFSEGVSSVF